MNSISNFLDIFSSCRREPEVESSVESEVLKIVLPYLDANNLNKVSSVSTKFKSEALEFHNQQENERLIEEVSKLPELPKEIRKIVDSDRELIYQDFCTVRLFLEARDIHQVWDRCIPQSNQAQNSDQPQIFERTAGLHNFLKNQRALSLENYIRMASGFHSWTKENSDYIETLDLRGCQLSHLPKEVFQFKNLKALDVESNNITEIPREISKLKKLKGFDASYNRITVLPKELSNLDQLEYFSVYRNPLGFSVSSLPTDPRVEAMDGEPIWHKIFKLDGNYTFPA